MILKALHTTKKLLYSGTDKLSLNLKNLSLLDSVTEKKVSQRCHLKCVAKDQ